MRWPRRLPVVLFAALLAAPASAEELRVPRTTGLVLDGRLAEEGWAAALALPVEPARVPPRQGAPASAAEVRPTVKVTVADGSLWIGVEIPEDVGFASGVKGMVGLPGAATAADALSFAFMPQDLRSPLYVARGPRGVGRGVYRVRGALDRTDVTRTRIEVALPLADLGLPTADAPLRVGVVVNTRTPAAIAWAPAGAKFEGPETWLTLLPPEGGWGAGDGPDAAALAEEDKRDEARLAAWRKHLEGRQKPIPPGTPEQTLALVRSYLLDPLDEVLAQRPDLAYVHVVRASIFAQLGRADDCLAASKAALEALPGLREAYLTGLLGFAQLRTEAPPEKPSDYAAALAAVDEAAKGFTDPYEKDAAALARGLLLYKRGDFAEAVALLKPIAEHYPFLPLAVEHAERAARYAEAWPAEQQYRARDDAKGDLPRVRIVTSKGPVVVELYLDDAPNSVKNFVWLARHGFYDGSLFHRNVPFFVAQGGDPLSKDPTTKGRAGTGGPGYAIPTEPGVRKPFRGVIAMARGPQRNTEGSQFFLTTGTAAHLDGDYTVFGRVLEGQDVAERLVQDDRIEKVEVLRVREGVEYRPTTAAGSPAPDPK